MLPRPGDVLSIGAAASIQFRSPILLRVIRCHDWPTYEGWVWLDGYQLDSVGEAVERRSVFVQLAGLRDADRDVRSARPVRPGRSPAGRDVGRRRRRVNP